MKYLRHLDVNILPPGFTQFYSATYAEHKFMKILKVSIEHRPGALNSILKN